jgi:hypothetical protein
MDVWFNLQRTMNYTTDSIETWGVYYNIPESNQHVTNQMRRMTAMLMICFILLIVLVRGPRHLNERNERVE